jgi:hypothetical protein
MDDNEEADSQQTGHLEVVRIYFNRLHLAGPRSGFWKRVTMQSAAIVLAKEALHEGITFALVTLATAGFVRGAKHVQVNTGEVLPETLPSCLELVGSTRRVKSFLDARKAV